MENIGVIDIGTNSMRLMLCQVDKGKIIHRRKWLHTTRMGQGIDKEGRIGEEVLERNFHALKDFLDQAAKEKADKILVFATSALRDATNRQDFIQRVSQELGICVHILSGKQEAEVGFKGVIGDIQEKKLLVIDIGGGSTELILGNKEEGIQQLVSMNVGALRMTEKYVKGDVISSHDLEKLQEDISREVFPIVSKIPISKDTRIVGIGGTITTLSAIYQKMEEYDWKKIHQSQISIEDIQGILEDLRKRDLENRKKLKGLQPARADIIIAGVVILKCIMEILNIEKLMVSESDNLEGMLYDYLGKR